tara:strand:- start:14973 stop:15398 length:426 start_codon:yes stop_codon:yes gene_type:complete
MLKTKRNLTVIVLVAVGIAAGPVSAQALFTCSMMDTAPSATCCCDDQLRCDDWDGDTPGANRGGCCDISIEIQADFGRDQSAAIGQPVEIRSNVDPPPVGLVDFLDGSSFYYCDILPGWAENPRPTLAGNRTYLVTQRLRI